MKKMLYLTAAVLAFSLSSCEKCSECACISETVYEFDENFDATSQDAIESQYNKEFDEDYPDLNEEICSKRRDFDDDVTSFENQSYSFTDQGTVSGNAWSVSFDRDCTCEE